MPAAVASPYFLLAAMILFSLVAYDVRGPGLRLLPQYVDGPAHAWLVSDFFISLGIIGWVFSLSASIARDPVPALKRGALCISIYFLGGGSIKGRDPFLVDQLKGFFHRMRPTELNHTYAFPSGHTTAATFIFGACLGAALVSTTAMVSNALNAKDNFR
eukprot:jgi/Astpho2/5592/Aster-x1303